VIFNIFKNASKAFNTGNKNSPDPNIIIDLFEDSIFVCLEIEDNGPGMDEMTQKRVFEPFFYNETRWERNRSWSFSIVFYNRGRS
jgi:signal transduction histidine kinase